MRCTLKEISENMDFDRDTHVLKVMGKEIGFVYYRSGYQVEQYTCDRDWETRTQLEISQAIKCPSIDFHLTTFKKFQQAFCDHATLRTILGERFQSDYQSLASIFSGICSLEDYDRDESVRSIVHNAIENPNKYVVKPQKEGGGNNFYDEEAKKLLMKFIDPTTETEERDSLKQYIVMERIYPPCNKTWMFRDGELFQMDSLSEMGLYSCIFMDTDDHQNLIQFNETFGTLLRTKGSHSNEGGVNTGYAVLDQPVLVKQMDLSQGTF
jgi:glutathione synthase